tara:strand:- start:899 stop:1351 length:453 start_codon:yes stop_codon:yes gene_type:complete
MDLKKLQNEISSDEGVKLEVYLDHLGLPTIGCGHLILEQDEEYGCEVGTKITQERCDDLFTKDLLSTVQECKKLYEDFDKLPDECKLIIANMMFNMGRPRLSGFKKMHQAVMDGDWHEASLQMRDSKWYNQVTKRAERLCKRMEAIGKGD